jgi:glyoxylase-like metal-dependent hydrolase (beta-lactamase superfamily II)
MQPWFPRWIVFGVSFLLETEQGLVLIDTGLGLHDFENPQGIVKFFTLDFGIVKDPQMALCRQLAAAGYHAEDVKHIVLTHLHFDHAGGLPDFPQAKVHVHKREYDALQHSHRLIERGAYDKADFAHTPEWVLYDRVDSRWFDFEAIRLPFSPEMYLIPLFGHTSGHCGVAFKSDDGWIFYAADSIPTNAQFDLLPPWLSQLVLGRWISRLKQFSFEHPEVNIIAGHSKTNR